MKLVGAVLEDVCAALERSAEKWRRRAGESSDATWHNLCREISDGIEREAVKARKAQKDAADPTKLLAAVVLDRGEKVDEGRVVLSVPALALHRVGPTTTVDVTDLVGRPEAGFLLGVMNDDDDGG